MFVQHHRDQKLQQYTGSLDRMAELVDSAKVAAAVDAACSRPDRSMGECPPYLTKTIVRVLYLQALYNLSDEEAEHPLLDRRTFQRFCGLADKLRSPDARTIWLFKQRLSRGELDAQSVFDAVQQQLQAHGNIPRGGQTIDATIVRVPIQHPTKDEKAKVYQGKTPENWSPKKTVHKDTDARWTTKYKKNPQLQVPPHVDARWKLKWRWAVTPANVDDGKTLPKVVAQAIPLHGCMPTAATTTTPTARYWPTVTGRTASRARPARAGTWRACQGPQQGHQLPARSRVEYVFAQLHHRVGKIVCTVTLARNELAIALKCAAYNIKRLVWLQANVVAS
jgi:IS5 family transposase